MHEGRYEIMAFDGTHQRVVSEIMPSLWQKALEDVRKEGYSQAHATESNAPSHPF